MFHTSSLVAGRQTTTVPALVHLVRKLSLAYVDAMAALAAGAGLHRTDLRALIELLDAEREERRLGAGDLGRALGMTTQATTALVKRLEKQGLVTRQRSSADGRRVELLLTPRALDLGWYHFGDLVAVLNDAVSGLCDADQATVEQLIERALNGLKVLAETRRHVPS